MKKSLNKILILLLLLAVAICAMTACDNTQREKSIFEMWLEQGHSGTEADFLEWLRGDSGQDGNDGNDGNDGKDIHGLSAYEIPSRIQGR